MTGPVRCARHPDNPVGTAACVACGDFLCPSCTLAWYEDPICPACWEASWLAAAPRVCRRALAAIGATVGPGLLVVVAALAIATVGVASGADPDALDPFSPVAKVSRRVLGTAHLVGVSCGFGLALDARRLDRKSPWAWAALGIAGLGFGTTALALLAVGVVSLTQLGG